MTMRDLIPWGRSRTLPISGTSEEGSPFLTLQREMNRVFEDFFRGFGELAAPMPGSGGKWPSLDVAETEKEFRIAAELPGLDEKDINVTFHDGLLAIKGEKKSENVGQGYSERRYGSFYRSVPLGPEADPDKIEASLRNGVLTILVGKRPETESTVKRIPVKA